MKKLLSLFKSQSNILLVGFLLYLSSLAIINQSYFDQNKQAISQPAHFLLNLNTAFSYLALIFLVVLFIRQASIKFSIKSWIKFIALFIGFTGLKFIIEAATSSPKELTKFNLNYAISHLIDPNSLTFFLRFLGLALLWIVLTFLLRISSKTSRLPFKFPETKKTFYASFLSILILGASPVQEFLRSLVFSRVFQNSKTIEWASLVHTSFNLLIIFSLIYIGSLLFIQGMRDWLKMKTSFALSFTSSSLLAILLSLGLQSVIQIETTHLLFLGFLLNVIIFSSLFLMIYALVNRYLIASIINLLLSLIIIIGNALKFKARQEPVALTDLVWLKSPGQLLSFIGQVNWWLFALIALAVAGLSIWLHLKLFKGKIFAHIYSRLLLIFLALLPVFYINHGIAKGEAWFRGDIWSKHPSLIQKAMANLSSSYWRGNAYVASQNGFILSFIHQAQITLMPKMPDYSKTKMDEISKKYSQLAQEINQNRTENIQEQTVIYILSESLSNPQRVPGIKLSQNPLPNLSSLAKQNGGLMVSSGYGGGTANMEFETISSLSKNNFDPSVSVAYNSAIPKMNYLPSISHLFDRRVIIHPEDAINYDRNIVYKKLNFTDFIARKHGSKELSTSKRYGNFISDQSSYQNLLNQIKENQGQFLELLTIQNHMPYNGKLTAPDISITDHSGQMSKDNLKQLNYYTKLISQTDQDTTEFLDQLSKIKQKITVVFYGDHLPGLYPESMFKNNEQAMRETDYFIWSNQGKLEQAPKVSSTYQFTPQLLKSTNSKVTPYYALLTQNLEQLPIMQNQTVYDPQTGKILTHYEPTKAQTELEEDYKLVQYDLTMGKGYLKKAFFEKITE